MDRSVWYDSARVERTVTKKFVCSHLLPGEIENLDQPLAFGDGLTDCTYWEWIQERAKRLFLILIDLGVPDQIFGVVDDSWEDADLPIPLDHVDRLALTATKDPKFDAKFYARQFFYLVRNLHKYHHVDYRIDELVPIHIVERRLTHYHTMDKVEMPYLPGIILCRRRFSLGQDCKPGVLSEDEFMSRIQLMKDLQNDHMFSYWASYTHQGYGYIFFNPVSDYKLSSFLANNQSSWKNLNKCVRQRMVLDWIHCLIDTIGFVHSRGLFMGAIKPSAIFLTHNHHIFLPDAGGLCPDLSGNRGTTFDKEAYDYAAPEQWFKPTKSAPTIRRHNDIPGSSTFSISRGHSDTVPLIAAQQAISQQLNAQAVDIFALGCVILDILSHGLLKRRSASAFAAHRAAKHKSAGRGGAIPDSSFHKNLGQVESWMVGMAKDAKDAAKKATSKDDGDEGRLYQAVAPLLHVVEKMLAVQPAERPSAVQVQSWIYSILTDVAGIAEPHCVHKYADKFHANDTAAATVQKSTVSSSGFSEQVSTFLDNESLNNSTEETNDDDHSTAVGEGTSTAPVRSSVFGFTGRSHRRNASENSSGSKGSSSAKSDREGWEMGSGLKAIQNLRINGKTRS